MKPETRSEKSPSSAAGEGDSPPQRPKRNVIQKSMDYNNGLLWREEKDLKKALYASLQESKRFRPLGGDELNGDDKEGIDGNRRLVFARPETEQDASPKRTRVHAQRKFAQGSTPNSPAPTPFKICASNNIATDLLPCRRPKTEDFLTFLCLRGTPILPPALDFLNNCAKSDTSSESRSQSPEPEVVNLPVTKDVPPPRSGEHKDKTSTKPASSENSSPRKNILSKPSIMRRKAHETKDNSGNSDLPPPDDNGLNNQHQQRGQREVSNMRKRKLISKDSETPKSRTSLKSGHHSSSTSGRMKPHAAAGGTSVQALKEKYKQQRLAKKITSHNKKESAVSGSTKRTLQTRSQTANKKTRVSSRCSASKDSSKSRVVAKSAKIVKKHYTSRKEEKLALEKRKSLRSAKTENPPSPPPPSLPPLPPPPPITRQSTQSTTMPWLRKAKQPPPVLDIDSENESEMSRPLRPPSKKIKINDKPKTLQKDDLITTRHTKNSSEKPKKSLVPHPTMSTRKSALSNSGHSYMKHSQVNKVSSHAREKLKLARKAAFNLKKKNKLKKFRKHPIIAKTMSLRSEPEILKRVTRSAKLKEFDEFSYTKPEKKINSLDNQICHKTTKHKHLTDAEKSGIVKKNKDSNKMEHSKVKVKSLHSTKYLDSGKTRLSSAKLRKESSKSLESSKHDHVTDSKKITFKEKKKIKLSKLHSRGDKDKINKSCLGSDKKLNNSVSNKDNIEKGKDKSDKSSKFSKLKHSNHKLKDSKKDSKLIKDKININLDKEMLDKSILGEKEAKEKIKKDHLFHSPNKSSKHSSSDTFDIKLSPKKKKKLELGKDVEKHGKSSAHEVKVFDKKEEFKEEHRKIKTVDEKSERKKLISKSKKHKKLDLLKGLKSNKSSKKLSSKLLNKYSKKKGFKSKKNKLGKLKKKEKKEMGTNKDNSGEAVKALTKSLKQKHKDKSENKKDELDIKLKEFVSPNSISGDKHSLEINEKHRHLDKTSNVHSCTSDSGFSQESSTCCNSSQSTSLDSCSDDTEAANSYIIENMSEGVASFDAMAGEMAHTLPGDLVFGSAEEIQSLMTSEFSGVFDEAFTTGAILLTTRDSLTQVPLHFIQELTPPKTMADAATNTCEEDILACMSEGTSRSEETSVGTQTMTPVASPTPGVEMIPSGDHSIHNSHSSAKLKAKLVPKPGLPISLPNVPHVKKRGRPLGVVKKFKKKEPFPGPCDPPKMVDAPEYYPSLEEFQDPLEFIHKIQPEAEQYGICKIIPPSSFKPECKVNDDMRFTAHNQFVHKMLYRWGPNVEHVTCIKKHLHSQGINLEQAPLIGGIELDLSRFYHTVQHFGGLQQVIEKKKWQRVADVMHIPKAAHDRVTKLYDAYCKYLVPYDTLPPEEKQRLQEEVIREHERRVKQRLSQREGNKVEEDLDEEEGNDCVTKGRSMCLSSFYRVARNTMAMWYKNEPLPEEVEHDFWKLVSERKHHVVVHAGNIDSSVYGSGFPCNRNSPFAKHPWNLKVLTNNPGSILRCMGPVSGVTIPTLHVGMLFTTGCWYRDPHSLPWIEYLHTGASKIWYGIPTKGSEKFRAAMKEIMPDCCTSNPIWLPSDTAMVPPDLLVAHNASLSRTVQNSGQFIIIFPEAFTSTICSGYSVSESVYFASPEWLDLSQNAFKDIRNSCEPPAFSLERLLFCIANDPKTQPETLQKILPVIEQIREQELQLRKQLYDIGLKTSERLPLLEVRDKKKKSRGVEDESEQECEVCRTHCYVSMVVNSQEESVYCLTHAGQHIQKKKNLKFCKLMYTYDQAELNELVKRISEQINTYLLKSGARKKSPKKKPVVPDK